MLILEDNDENYNAYDYHENDDKNVPGGASDDHVGHEELRMIMKMMML